MSKILGDSLQINNSPTATNNFDLSTDGAGGMKIARGNHGATTQDILTVDASGKVVLPQGMGSSVGSFYETGTFTPTLTTTGTPWTGLTNTSTGSYVKIGKVVIAQFNVTSTGTAGGGPTGNVIIGMGSLPNSTIYSVAAIDFESITLTGTLGYFAQAQGSYVGIYFNNSAAPTTGMPASAITGRTAPGIFFTLTYFA